MVFIVKIPLKSKQQEQLTPQPEQPQEEPQDAPAPPNPTPAAAASNNDALDLLASLASMSLTSRNEAAVGEQQHDSQPEQQQQQEQRQPRSSTPPAYAPSSSTLSSPPPLSPLEATPASAAAVPLVAVEVAAPETVAASVKLEQAASPAAVLDVYLAPAVEQHRYVRSRDVSLIVERPQRIRAVCLAVAAALARCNDDSLTSAMEGMAVADAGAPKAEAGPAIRVLHSQAAMRLAAAPPALLSIHGAAMDDASPEDVKPGESYVAYLARLCAAAPSAPPSLALRSTAREQAPMTPTREVEDQLDAQAGHERRNSSGGAESSDSSSGSSAGNFAPGASEVPAPWSQGDLYLCGPKGDDGGSLGAIEASLGTLCAALDALYLPSAAATAARSVLLPGPAPRAAAAPAKRAFILTRPPGHHCGSGSEGGPSGFCWVNNVAVGAAHAYAQHGVDRVIVLDLDLHHGNGTQAIAWRINAETARSDLEREARLEALRLALAKAHGARKTATARRSAPSVTAEVQDAAAALETQVPKRGLKIFYGSMHDIESYPCENGDADLVRDASTCVAGAHGQWIWNVHLESTDTPAAFERVYREKYLTLLTQARLFATQTSADPSRTLVVLSTGMDACIGELPGLQRHGKSLPVDFYHRFTVDACALAADVSGGKLISVLEGGYSDRALTSASLAHCAALATASSSSSSSLSSASAPPSTPKEWWDADALLALEKLSKRLATAAPSTPAAIASAAARRRAEPAWLQATGAHFEVLERACGREQPRRAAKTAASAPVSPAGSNTAPRMGTRGARNRTQLGEASAADTTV